MRCAGKKSTQMHNTTPENQDAAEDSDDAQDATGEDLSSESYVEAPTAMVPTVQVAHIPVPEQGDRRSTFTFTMETEASEVMDHESPAQQQEDWVEETLDNASAEDATLMYLFRSPTKGAAMPSFEHEQIHYPQLPPNDNEEVVLETLHAAIEDAAVITGRDEVMSDDEAEEAAAQEERALLIEDQVASEVQEQRGVVDTETSDLDIANPTLEPHSPAVSSIGAQGASEDVAYPALPTVSSLTREVEPPASSPTQYPTETAAEEAENVEEAVSTTGHYVDSNDPVDINMDDDVAMGNDMDAATDEEFTEASLQLDIQRNYEKKAYAEQSLPLESTEEALVDSEPIKIDREEISGEDTDIAAQTPTEPQTVDITDGLTLSFTPAKAPSVEPTPRKLHSPPPPSQAEFDDATMTIALDDDTALLKDFLNRAAASKAERAAVMTHRRESLQNRRDSDVIRHALSSPRKALEDKDPNSPSKYDNELTLDLSQTLTFGMDKNTFASPATDAADGEEVTDEKSGRASRRSSRTKKSRLPALASAAQAQPQTSKIAIRRADGTEHVVLKKSDAQELSLLTRANTRKNKQGAFGVTVTLMKLSADAANLPPLDDSTRELIIGKNIRWDEQLAYYQENPETVAEAESLATPDELGMSEPVSTPSTKPKSKVSKNSTPKIRRVRGLGTANGTPAKALLAPTSFDEEEKEAAPAPATAPAPAPAQAQQLPRPKASRIKKMTVASTSVSSPVTTKLPALDIAPVGVEPAKERKSRLAAPKKVTLPQPVAALPAADKENTQRSGIGGATPKKGIPAPKVIVPPTVGMESGLPRRRGRKI
jgi:hypothetical protein